MPKKITAEGGFASGEEFQEPFSPKEELEKVKEAPREERREKLKEFKERLLEQEKDIVEIQRELVEKVEADPKTPREALVAEFSKLAAEKGLSDSQKELGEIIIGEYSQKNAAVQRFRNVYQDDRRLFQTVFGSEPKGKVEVVAGPMTLYFRCFDFDDYFLIYSESFLENKKFGEQEKKSAAFSGGVFINSAKIPALWGTIIAEKAEAGEPINKEILEHEKQHAYKNLFYGMYFDFLKKESSTAELLNISPEKDKDKYLFLLERSLGGLRAMEAEKRAKDELLAFFKTGEDPEKIKEFLLAPKEKGGLYDYMHDWKEQLTDFGPEVPVYEIKLMQEAINKVFVKDYEDLLDGAIDAFESLEALGYKKSEAVAFLITKPLSTWNKWVRRLAKHEIKEEK